VTATSPRQTRTRFRSRAVLLGVAVAVAATDLVTKAVAARALAGRNTVDLPGPVDLALLFNPGSAFGLGAALPAGTVAVVTAILVAGLFWYAWRAAPATNRLGRAGLAVLLGGAVANLADRSIDGSSPTICTPAGGRPSTSPTWPS